VVKVHGLAAQTIANNSIQLTVPYQDVVVLLLT
jgi:hypothetical protein